VLCIRDARVPDSQTETTEGLLLKKITRYYKSLEEYDKVALLCFAMLCYALLVPNPRFDSERRSYEVVARREDLIRAQQQQGDATKDKHSLHAKM